MKTSSKSILYAGFTILLWATVASAFKITLRIFSNDTMSVLFWASWIAFLSTGIIVIINKRSIKWRPDNAKELFSSMLMGLLNPFLYYLILFKAYALLPGQEAQPLNFIWPIVLTLLSVPLLKQSLSWKQMIAILVSFIGVFVISTRGNVWPVHISNALGAGLAVGSSVFWALYWIFNMRDQRNAVVKLFWNFGFGAVYISIFCLLYHPISMPSLQGFFGVLWIGCFEMGITFVLWLKALEYAENTAWISNFIFLTPFLSLLCLWFIAGEVILFSSVVGLILIVSGILIQNVFLSQ